MCFIVEVGVNKGISKFLAYAPWKKVEVGVLLIDGCVCKKYLFYSLHHTDLQFYMG